MSVILTRPTYPGLGAAGFGVRGRRTRTRRVGYASCMVDLFSGQQDGPAACDGLCDMEIHAPCVSGHKAAGAQNPFKEGAEAPAVPGGTLQREATLVHGLVPEAGRAGEGLRSAADPPF